MPSGDKQQKSGSAPKAPPPGPAPQVQQSQAVRDRNQAQVGALMRTTAKKDQDANRDETTAEREAWLKGQRRAIVQVLVDAAAQKLTSSLGAKLGKVVAAQKQQILDSARHAVQVKINQSQHGGESADLQADTLIGESDAWSDAASVSTEQAKTLVDTKRGALDAAANGAFTLKPGATFKKSDRAKHVATVTAEAKKLIDAKAKLVEVELTAEANKDTTKKQVVASAKKSARGAAIKGVGEEIKERHDHDAAVENAVKVPVDEGAERIRGETRTYLEKGVGAHGTGWFRSAQFKAFHAKMKEAARTKGHARTDDAIGEQRNSGGGAPGKKAAFEYQTMQAHVLTHEAAKMELRDVMKNFAGELLASTENTVHVDALLKTAATQAAWAKLRNDPDQAAARKSATAAVKAAEPGVLKTFHAEAQKLKNEYVKVGDDPTAQPQKDKNQEVVDQKVEPAFEAGKDKKGEKFGKKMLQQAMEAPTAGKGLQFVAKLIDLATPQVGDETELEVELKIPASHGAFVYFTVKGSATRSQHMELGIELNFGAGWETWGLSARGGFIVFLKAAAHDTVNAMQLIHYGAFRNLTHASNDAANFWAGVTDPKKTGSSGKEVGKTEQAELWASMTEERVFGKDANAFVEVGGGIGASAKLKAGIDGEVSAELTTARRWDKGVFDAVEKDPSQPGGAGTHGAGKMGDRATSNQAQRAKLAKDKRALVAGHVKRVNRLKLGTSIEAEANGQKFSLGLDAQYTGGEDGGWEIQITGGIPYDPSETGSSTMVSKIAGSYVPAALAGVKKIYDSYKAKHQTAGTKDEGGDAEARVPGAVIDGGEDLILGLDAGGMTNGLLKSLSEANPQGLEAGQDEGINDTARLWLGEKVGLKGAMGEHGDMSKLTSKVPDAKPFSSTSKMEISLMIERPNGGEAAKFAFKITKSKEMNMGGELGGGVGLTAKVTRKQDLGGVAAQRGKGVTAFSGGREGWVSTGLGGSTP